jgi:hypothetical protein
MYVGHICMYCMDCNTIHAIHFSAVALKPPPQPKNTFSGPTPSGAHSGHPWILCAHPLSSTIPVPPPYPICAPPQCRMRPGPLLLSSRGAGERPVPAARASILSQDLSWPIWHGSSPHMAGLGSHRDGRRPSKKLRLPS